MIILITDSILLIRVIIMIAVILWAVCVLSHLTIYIFDLVKHFLIDRRVYWFLGYYILMIRLNNFCLFKCLWLYEICCCLILILLMLSDKRVYLSWTRYLLRRFNEKGIILIYVRGIICWVEKLVDAWVTLRIQVILSILHMTTTHHTSPSTF